MDTTFRRQLGKMLAVLNDYTVYELEVVSDFCTSMFPKVMDNSNTSISSGLALRASRMASMSSTPYSYLNQLNQSLMWGVFGATNRVRVYNDSAWGSHGDDEKIQKRDDSITSSSLDHPHIIKEAERM